MFEWYDFYLYGSLAAIIAKQFFSGVNATAGFIFALLAFAAGFAVRPFGALVFGRLGDLVGPQVHLPGHHPDHGPVDLRRRPAAQLRRDRHRRADHPDRACACCRAWRSAASTAARRPTSPSTRRTGKRGLYTCWIQTTATLGPVPVAAGDPRRAAPGSATEAFDAWGWRIPFLLSIVLLGISVWIRLQLQRVARSSSR